MKKEETNSIKALGMAFFIFFKAGKVKAYMICITYVMISVIPSILLLVNKKIFEVFSSENFSVKIIIYFILFFAFLNLISILLHYIQSIMMNHTQHNISLFLHKKINDKLVKIQYSEMDNPEIKDLINRVSSTVPSKSSGLVFSVFSMVSMCIQFLLSCTILFEINWIIPILLVLFSLPYLFMYKRMCFDNYFLDVGHSKMHRKNWYLTKMLFEKHYNKELKHYHLFDYIGEKECTINKELHDGNYKLTKKYAVLGVLLDIIKGIGRGICMIWTIYLILFQDINISALTVLIQAMDSMQKGLLDIFSNIKELNVTSLIFNDYKKFISLEEEDGKEEMDHVDHICFFDIKNVSFTYVANQYESLKNINLSIKKGEKIAIVGRNGSGKTTLVNLLLGLYQPIKGSVEVCGNKLENCFEELRKRTIYIMQKIPQYGFSLDENLFMGNECKNKKIMELLEIAKVIEKAPFSRSTILGEENDDHYNLSGGEWAKIGIARNSQKESPILYILDEPTASLDPIMESKIYESFKSMTGDATTIFISHRLGMTRLVDRIVVMNDGRIVEMGNHTELMNQKGEYYTMYTEQKKLYLKEEEND